MNKKGFTLAELLAVIVIIAILSTIGYTSVSNSIEKSKEKSFEISVKNAKEAAIQLYKEVEDGSVITIKDYNGNDFTYRIIKDEEHHIEPDKIETPNLTIDKLIESGFLTANKSEEIIDPKTGKSINTCELGVKKINFSKITYEVYYIYSGTGFTSKEHQACKNAFD